MSASGTKRTNAQANIRYERKADVTSSNLGVIAIESNDGRRPAVRNESGTKTPGQARSEKTT